MTIYSLISDSIGLNEDVLEYTISTAQAKQAWVPYIKDFQNGEITHDVDYSIIEYKLPVITNLTGFYSLFEFQFNSTNLQRLATNLIKLPDSENLP